MATKKELQEQLALLEKINQATVDLQKELGEIETKQEEISFLMDKRKQNAEEILKFTAQLPEERAKQYEYEKKIFELNVEKGKLDNESRKLQEIALEQKRLLIKAEGDELDALTKKYKKEVEISKIREENLKSLNESKKRLGDIAKRMGGILGIGNRLGDTITGGLVVGMQDMVNIIIRADHSMENFGKSALSAVENIGDLGLGLFLSLAEEVAVAQDGIRANFIKTTGASRQFSQSVVDASDQMRQMGLQMGAAGEASTLLFQSVTAFRDATPAARKDAAVFVGTLIELGVSGQAAAGNMQLLTMGMDQTFEQAQTTTESMINFAKGINMDVNQAMDDFNDLAPELIAHGKGMDKVFKGLMEMSRKTGLSMQALVDVASQFDTFEGAATAVGRLNGMLGGPYLNSIEMVYATEEERLKTMQQAMQASGRQFKDLSRYEKKAVAAAAGFKSVGDAMFFFNKEAMDPAAREAAESQKSLADAARDAKPAQERLQMALMQLTVSMEPLLSGFISFIETLVENKEAASKAVFAFGGLFAVVKGYAMVTSLTTAFIAMKAAMALAAGGATILKYAFGALGTVGIIGLLVLLYQLYNLLFVGNSPSLIEVLGLVTAAVLALNLAMSANPLGLIVVAGVAAVGALYTLFKHMGIVEEGFAGIGQTIFLALTLPLNAAIGAINLLIMGLNKIPNVDIPSIDFLTLSSVPFFADGVNNFVGGPAIVGEEGPELVHLAKGTTVVPSDKTVSAAREAMGMTQPKVATAGGVSAEDLKTAFVAALKEVGIGSAGDGKIVAEQPIEVTIGKKVFGRAVMDVVKESQNLRLKPGAR